MSRTKRRSNSPCAESVQSWLLVECKSNDVDPSPALANFRRQLGAPTAFQLVTREGYDRVYSTTNVRVLSYQRFLAGWV